MQSDENLNNDPVWKLLGEASNAKADAMFSRNVMRSIRHSEQTKTTWRPFLHPFITISSFAAISLCITLLTLLQIRDHQQNGSTTLSAEESFSALSMDLETDNELESIMTPISIISLNDYDVIGFSHTEEL